MLAFVPVAFDVYRPLKPRLRWAMQCLVSFADHAGRCFPSIRTFARHAGIRIASVVVVEFRGGQEVVIGRVR